MIWEKVLSMHKTVGTHVVCFKKKVYERLNDDNIPSHLVTTHQGFLEEFIFSIILPKIQPAVCVHTPA